jgi:hypothetical protein
MAGRSSHITMSGVELVAEAVTVDVAAGRRPPGRARAARPVLTDGPARRPPAPTPAARAPERYRTLTPCRDPPRARNPARRRASHF